MESRRATLVDDISRQTGITDAMISDLVETFYGRVRQDPLLAGVSPRTIAARDAPYGSSSVSQ
jgi:truncated hemoglobin YjbI